jgi:excisionase family DNA binding protein
MSSQNDTKPLLTVREVAEILRVSSSLVYQLVEAQQLACHRIGKRKGAIRVAPADLDDYLARCRAERRDDTPKPKPPRPRLKHLKL